MFQNDKLNKNITYKYCKKDFQIINTNITLLDKNKTLTITLGVKEQ